MNCQKPSQETPSAYFNNILKKNVTPVNVTQLPQETIDWFNLQISEAFPDEADIVKHRVSYLIPYILQAIDWEEYGIPLEAWQLKFYYQRDRFLRKTGLSYEQFENHELLMDAVEQLGLDPVPTFEFILFLRYYYAMRSDLKFSPLEQLDRLKDALATSRQPEKIKMDVVVEGRHFKFDNSEFVRALFSSIHEEKLKRQTFADSFEEGGARDKTRALDYYMIKTLLDYLPVRIEERKGKFSQSERNFGLCVLNLCGRLIGEDTEGLCSAENNATFDKLMRDFKDAPIPFAMELFL